MTVHPVPFFHDNRPYFHCPYCNRLTVTVTLTMTVCLCPGAGDGQGRSDQPVQRPARPGRLPLPAAPEAGRVHRQLPAAHEGGGGDLPAAADEVLRLRRAARAQTARAAEPSARREGRLAREDRVGAGENRAGAGAGVGVEAAAGARAGGGAGVGASAGAASAARVAHAHLQPPAAVGASGMCGRLPAVALCQSGAAPLEESQPGGTRR